MIRSRPLRRMLRGFRLHGLPCQDTQAVPLRVEGLGRHAGGMIGTPEATITAVAQIMMRQPPMVLFRLERTHHVNAFLAA